MQPQQVWLHTAGGRIRGVRPLEGAVVIEREGQCEQYPGCWALPGFVDAHGHLVHYGLELGQPSLRGCRSAEECGELLRQWGPNRGEWLLGAGWDQEAWDPPTWPQAAVLDAVFPDIPVALRRVDGHALWVNSEALRRAGIDAETPDPPGGLIVRTATGKPTGVLIDSAAELLLRHVPAPSPVEIRQAILRATAQLVRCGITEVHDMDVDPQWVPLFHELATAGQLPIRIQSYVRAQAGQWSAAGLLPTTGEFFQLRGVKFYADGALGSYGAALLEPYADESSHRGLLFFPLEVFEQAVREALQAGWHVAIHAIGDAAVRQVARLFSRLRELGEPEQRRRVEHVQVVHPDDLPVLAEAGGIASVQPLHCIADAPMARRRLGLHRRSIPYPWRSLLEAGIPLAAGSDFPIAPPDVRAGLAAFCLRLPPGETTPWYPEECLEIEQALAAYTTWAHFAAAVDDRRGLLLPGYDADIVVLDRNPLHCPPSELSTVRIVAVYVAGRRRWYASEAPAA